MVLVLENADWRSRREWSTYMVGGGSGSSFGTTKHITALAGVQVHREALVLRDFGNDLCETAMGV
jgi:hypothetical protein